MNREIKFRGRRIDDGEWVFGDLIHSRTKVEAMIVDDEAIGRKVDPRTVGQYTGLKDQDGKEIYEKDIVKNRGYEELCIVEWYQGQYIGRYRPQTAYYQLDESKKVTERGELCYIGLGFYVVERNAIEIIGNIHEHPHLLGGNP